MDTRFSDKPICFGDKYFLHLTILYPTAFMLGSAMWVRVVLQWQLHLRPESRKKELISFGFLVLAVDESDERTDVESSRSVSETVFAFVSLVCNLRRVLSRF